MPLDGKTVGYLDIKKIAKRLDPDEDCLGATVVSPLGPTGKKGAGVICATTRRVIFASGLIPPFTLQEYPYHRINSIDFSQIGAFGVGKGVIRVNSGGASFDYEVWDIRGAQRVVDAALRQFRAPQQQQQQPGEQLTQAVPAPAVEDPLALLEALSTLRSEGLITEDEFESKKQELLTRI
jgi:hypothetical protein